nr:uncharacterized protein CTRU02_02561 [Colletotrichum truncatum]KAF6798587.1 hypothetical protein CTRU02_02561 [Colletotrichum truncatum]
MDPGFDDGPSVADPFVVDGANWRYADLQRPRKSSWCKVPGSMRPDPFGSPSQDELSALLFRTLLPDS